MVNRVVIDRCSEIPCNIHERVQKFMTYQLSFDGTKRNYSVIKTSLTHKYSEILYLVNSEVNFKEMKFRAGRVQSDNFLMCNLYIDYLIAVNVIEIESDLYLAINETKPLSLADDTETRCTALVSLCICTMYSKLCP